MITGEAAGTAAGLSVVNGVEPRDLDLKMLQDALRENRVLVD